MNAPWRESASGDAGLVENRPLKTCSRKSTWRRGLRVLGLAASLGLPAVAFAAAVEPKAVVLPPFLVEETAKPLRWRYAEVAAWEVLSTCPDRLTRDLVANHHRLHTLLGELVPPALQWNTTERQTLVFVDSAQLPVTSPEVVARLSLSATEQERLADIPAPVDDGKLRRRPPPPRYSFVPNLRLWDRDTGTLFALVKESAFDPTRVGLTADYVAYVLRQRRPELPPWYLSGVLTLFAQATFAGETLVLDRLNWPAKSGAAVLKSGPDANRAVLPLAEFFAGPSTEEAQLAWQAQAALFVRWGLAAPRRPAFTNFVARAAAGEVTEALFQECFGLDFAAAHQQLTAYLPEAQGGRLALRPTPMPRLLEFPIRAASDAEVSRIKGDWERLEIGYVKAQFPVLGPKYVEQARRTLRRAYDGGSRDPRLLAVMGLCEVDAGNDSAAREFLEAAAAGGPALRSRAWFELARLRFAGVRRGGAELTPAQASVVLTPLLAARAQQPPLAEVYDLIAEVWAASGWAPTREALAVLEEGVRTFPRRSDLVYRTAELNVRHGFNETARWLITLGLALAPDGAARTRFEALQARLR
jgi:hypothetical protein